VPDIGERLESIRRLRMWTQARLAKEAGVSPTTVSAIETGKIGRPHFGTIGKLAGALRVAPKNSSVRGSPSRSKVLCPCRWGGLERAGMASSSTGSRVLPSKASTSSLVGWMSSKSAFRGSMGNFPRAVSRDGS
jgi:DNA-binding XRE family transcriptional regulator